MDALTLSMELVEWWKLLLVGFLSGLGAGAAGLMLVFLWAQQQPYMAGPFSRNEDYRLSPPRDDAAA